MAIMEQYGEPKGEYYKWQIAKWRIFVIRGYEKPVSVRIYVISKKE